MKAIRLSGYGGKEKLEITEIPTPAPSDDEILVKIKNTAVNHLDLLMASGAAKRIFPIKLPWIPGHEFSGIIEKTGKNVKTLKVGDEVFGGCPEGSYAEYLVADPGLVAKKPANLSFAEAASVPVAAQTAWQGLFTHGHLTKGQTVLIHGAAGGVGAYVVQFAHDIGAKVITVASSDDADYLISLGADQVINYKTSKFENEIKEKVDLVLDLIGGDTQKRSYTVIKEGGYLIATGQPVSMEDAEKYKVSAIMMNVVQSAEGLGAIAKLLEEKKIKPDVAKIYPLSQIGEAWEDISGNLSKDKATQPASQKKANHGKLVIEVA